MVDLELSPAIFEPTDPEAFSSGQAAAINRPARDEDLHVRMGKRACRGGSCDAGQHRRHEAVRGPAPGQIGPAQKGHGLPASPLAQNFVQSVFDSLDGFCGQTQVVGGDGRYLGHILVGRGGLLSTPAASCVIRKHQAFGGIRWPRGRLQHQVQRDQRRLGAEKMTEAIYRRTQTIREYRTLDAPDVPFGREGASRLGDAHVEVVDLVADHRDLMESLFDFDAWPTSCVPASVSGSMRCRPLPERTPRPILEDTLGALRIGRRR